MYVVSVLAYVAVVIWFILSFLRMGGNGGYQEAMRNRTRVLISLFSVIVVGIICAIMNPWFWLYLPLTFVVLAIALWILILVDERNRWGKK